MTQNLTRPQGRSLLDGVPSEDIRAIAETKIANLELALRSARTIGMAVGILVERLKVSSDEAFAVLVETSQHTHRKLKDIEEELVYTGELPRMNATATGS
jgi:AmiR/NasT family two-component response regulator